MKKELSFEQAMSELDQTVDKLSGGNLPLEEMIKLYERGNELCAYCTKLLDAYDARLSKLDASTQGEQGEE